MFSSTPKELRPKTTVGQAGALPNDAFYFRAPTDVVAMRLKYKELGSPISVVTAAGANKENSPEKSKLSSSMCELLCINGWKNEVPKFSGTA